MKRAAKVALLTAAFFRPGIWDEQAEAWAKHLPHDNPDAHAAELGAMVQSGKAGLLEIVDYSGRIGVLIYSLDYRFPRPEFVIHAGYDSVNHECVTATFLPRFVAVAAAKGCGSLRFNTVRAGLIKAATQHGCVVSEVIMRCEIPPHV